jgi:hypothetical protein
VSLFLYFITFPIRSPRAHRDLVHSSPMPPKVEFVVYTGDTTVAKKDKAHRKAIRSFVTAQHYREKRRIDTRTYQEQRRPSHHESLGEPHRRNPTPEIQPVTEFGDILLPNSKGEYEATIIDVGSLNATANASGETALSAIDYTHAKSGTLNRASDDRAIRLAAAWPSPYSCLGQGIGNPFITRSRKITDRMEKHLFYCS